MSLTFNAKAHRYTLDGKKVTGVTTILNAGIPKPALVHWAAKSVAEFVADNEALIEQMRPGGREPLVSYLKAVPNQKKTDAAVRGTDIHKIAEQIILGESVEVPAHLVAHVEGYARLIDDFQIEPLFTERSVANRKRWYAGRFDCIAKFRGETWLLDWKTSKGIYGETSLQTATYASSEFMVTDDDPDTEIPMPHIDRIGVVHITESGSTIHDLGDIKKSFKIFTHVQFLANQTDYIKGLVSEPLSPSA